MYKHISRTHRSLLFFPIRVLNYKQSIEIVLQELSQQHMDRSSTRKRGGGQRQMEKIKSITNNNKRLITIASSMHRDWSLFCVCTLQIRGVLIIKSCCLLSVPTIMCVCPQCTRKWKLVESDLKQFSIS